MLQESIETIVSAYFANIAAMNPEGWIENFAEDALSYDPVGEPPAKVHERYRDFIGQLQAFFDKLEPQTEHIFVTGNEAAVKWTMHGVSKTGKPVVFEGITIFAINPGGKIQTTRAYWNPAKMVTQLPFPPAPGPSQS
ncbi:nuclear transport factor 2 family protein [Umezakia ovalisporum]|uniref:Nuclear transport factor 2 family protein n=1 Tax=Umezakia ovalisporum FSS-43 TaxID=2740520 RepID=A0ABT6K514_9CYAN|nr:nuclear transport factor 2 family protein [Umezakia ovalisporum]MDH6057425.1 nuclear transport factor 2 family protein [Umezakia ovalisporum FSS-43]MDH6065937.1 nuclear transport factor 2 family protein [Umezakia ovalisporum APH033B]MDH6070815.1 nuclear transport factor 2 family protein [Umezakia ovalisporum CobakiLakeA]MDH6074933.1 nuclear transport factor 2 family protein [Umezakia ovalisporum CS-1034]MDH6079773.1 nuclear transport factor 2 family protein [Umezakia ovalisporum FSS-45]